MSLSLPPSLLAPFFKWERFSVTCPVGTPTQFLPVNFDRYSILFLSPNGIWRVAPDNSPSATSGWLLPAAGSEPVVITFRQIGALIGESWFASNGGGGAASIIGYEIIWRPPRRQRGA